MSISGECGMSLGHISLWQRDGRTSGGQEQTVRFTEECERYTHTHRGRFALNDERYAYIFMNTNVYIN